MQTLSHSRSHAPRRLSLLLALAATALFALVGAARTAGADGEGTFSFAQASYDVQEGDVALLTVTRSGGTGAIDIEYNVNNPDGAPIGVTEGIVSFGEHATEATIAIATGTDANDVSETFTVTLIDPAGDATLGAPAIAAVKVHDKDGPPAFRFETDEHEVHEGDEVTVLRYGGRDVAHDVDVIVGGGSTAVVDENYQDPATTLTFAAGVAAQDVAVQTLDDGEATGNLTLELELDDPSDGSLIDPDATVITIVDTENGILEFSQAAYLADGNDGSFDVTVNRSAGSSGEVTVGCVSVPGGTAVPGVDYTVVDEVLTFEDGQTSATCTVEFLGTITPGEKTVHLALTGAAGTPPETAPVIGAQSTAVLTIEVTEATVIEFEEAVYEVEKTEDTATITVIRSGDTSGESSASWTATLEGDPDIEVASGDVVFGEDETSATFNVPLTHEALEEGEHTITLALTDPIDAALGDQDTAMLLVQEPPPPETVTYTLHFRWSLYAWDGPEGVDIMDLLENAAEGSAPNIDQMVTAIWAWDNAGQAWGAWFRQAAIDGLPGVNAFTTLTQGQAYWFAINTEGAHDWVVLLEP